MERFMRKLKLLHTQVNVIDNESDINKLVRNHIRQKQNVVEDEVIQIKKVTKEDISKNDFSDSYSYLPLFEASLAVDESGIIFIEDIIYQYFLSRMYGPRFIFLVRETNIVWSIEIAMFKIKNAPTLSDKCLEIIQPEMISAQGFVFILRE
jgi:hypothetical protein